MKNLNLISRRFNSAGNLPRSVRVMKRVAIAGLGVACAALVVASAIGLGFERTYSKALMDFNAHLVVMGSGEMTDYNDVETIISGLKYASADDIDFAQRWKWLLPYAGKFSQSNEGSFFDRLSKLSKSGIKDMTPFLYREALAIGGGKIQGVVFKGIDAESFTRVNPMSIKIFNGQPSLERALLEKNGCVLGQAAAKYFGVEAGSKLRVMIPKPFAASKGSGEFREMDVVGVFESGVYDYDRQFILVSLNTLRQLFAVDDRAVTGIEISLYNPQLAELVSGEVKKILGDSFSTVTWGELNRDLLSAVRLERLVSAIIMGIMVAVAGLNIVSVLVLMAIYRMRELSILKALGLSNHSIRALMVRGGLDIGVKGAVVGIVLGVVVAKLISALGLVPIDPEIYMVGVLPVDISPAICCIIALFCVAVVFMTSRWTAGRLAKVSVGEGIR